MEIIDISVPFFSCPVYPGDPLPKSEKTADYKNGDIYTLSCVSACVHTGTHIDAPLHFVEDGKSIDQLGLKPFIGECLVWEANGEINQEAVERIPLCERLLIKGGGKAYFSPEGAQAAADRGILLAGIDSLSVSCKGEEAAVHTAFFKKDVFIAECLDLSKVTPGTYFLFAPPVKFDGLEGAPARAVLLKNDLSF